MVKLIRSLIQFSNTLEELPTERIINMKVGEDDYSGEPGVLASSKQLIGCRIVLHDQKEMLRATIELPLWSSTDETLRMCPCPCDLTFATPETVVESTKHIKEKLIPRRALRGGVASAIRNT